MSRAFKGSIYAGLSFYIMNVHPSHEILVLLVIFVILSGLFKEQQQCLVIEGNQSSWLSVTSGMPEDNILRLLLFDIDINELLSILPSFSTILYADDTLNASNV